MEIITEYSPNSIKNAGFEATHKNIFRIASPTAKSKLIEFFDDSVTVEFLNEIKIASMLFCSFAYFDCI